MSGHTFHSCDDRQTLTRMLAAEVLDLVGRELDCSQRAGLVVSGGSTPVELFKVLAASKCDWARVHITLADERWVDVRSAESNEGLVRRGLLTKRAAAARFTGLKTAHPTPLAAEQACAVRLQTVPQPFAASLLGMGTDGHTASLFPGAPELARGLALSSTGPCLQITPPHGSHLRMTLSLPTLLNSRRLLLHITGEDKLAVYRQALAGDDPYLMPIRSVLQQDRTEVVVYWAP